MNVVLGPDLERFITERVKTGRYPSPEAEIAEGLRLLGEQEMSPEEIERLRREVRAGTEQAERGELVDGEAVFERLRRLSRAVPMTVLSLPSSAAAPRGVR